MSEAVLEIAQLSRSFRQGDATIQVLRGVNLSIQRGEVVALLGASGAGKSTLLQAVGLLEGGFEGEIKIGGVSCSALSNGERTQFRRDKLGFVYQFHHLLPDFTALENVAMPQLIAGRSVVDAHKRAGVLLSELGLAQRLHHQPAQLSGGEQQRVAVARALANEPILVLADEPTGNLDEDTGRTVFQSFVKQVREKGSSALIATHNKELARSMDRIVVLYHGVLQDAEPTP